MGHIDHLCCIKRGEKGPGVFIKNIEKKKRNKQLHVSFAFLNLIFEWPGPSVSFKIKIWLLSPNVC